MLDLLRWEFSHPWLLLLALLAPVVFALARRSSSAVVYSSLELLDRAPRSMRARLASIPAFLLALGTLSLAVAMSGPRVGDSTSKVRREGIAICMVVDRSGSMQALDLRLGDEAISRLDAVKQVFREFVLGDDETEGRPDDLIGIVTFGTYADGVCPLTLDHRNLIAILDQLQIATVRSESGTAIGEGLALAVERLREHEAQSKVIILLTDGVNNSGTISPKQAAELAADHNIRVYTIGAGTNGEAPVPMETPLGIELRKTRVEIDEDTLKEIARKNNGRYYRATDGAALRDIVQEIDQLERSEVIEIRYLQYTERYPLFALTALVLLLAATLSAGTVFRRLP